MSEVEKMYENAGVEPQYKKRIECKEGHSIGQPCGKSPCIDCDKSVFEDVMPPFTAEKPLELVKWCCKKCRRFYIYNINDIDNFAKNLAKEFNHYWQDLTEQERTEIRRILNGS